MTVIRNLSKKKFVNLRLNSTTHLTDTRAVKISVAHARCWITCAKKVRECVRARMCAPKKSRSNEIICIIREDGRISIITVVGWLTGGWVAHDDSGGVKCQSRSKVVTDKPSARNFRYEPRKMWRDRYIHGKRTFLQRGSAGNFFSPSARETERDSPGLWTDFRGLGNGRARVCLRVCNPPDGWSATETN